YFLGTNWPREIEILNANASIGYSWSRFLTDGVSLGNLRNIFLSTFSHVDIGHLGFNLVTLLTFGGTLELALGHLVMAASFLVGAILTNPLTSMILIPLISWVDPGRLEAFVQEVDIGASLGVFAVFGAL